MTATHKLGPSISIVIPAYNEGRRIGATLRSLEAFCRRRYRRYELLCVDDGSQDDTRRQVQRLQIPAVRLIVLPQNCGKGFAVARGMRQAAGEICFFTDADLPYGIGAFDQAMALFETRNCDLVIGVRQARFHCQRKQTGLLRCVAGGLFAALASMLMGVDLLDPQCGFKGFRQDAAQQIFGNLKSHGYVFDVEALALAHLQGLNIFPLPVSLLHHKGSKVRLSRDSLLMLVDLLRVYRRYGRRLRRKPAQGILR